MPLWKIQCRQWLSYLSQIADLDWAKEKSQLDAGLSCW
jgi:hypothetical protein